MSEKFIEKDYSKIGNFGEILTPFQVSMKKIKHKLMDSLILFRNDFRDKKEIILHNIKSRSKDILNNTVIDKDVSNKYQGVDLKKLQEFKNYRLLSSSLGNKSDNNNLRIFILLLSIASTGYLNKLDEEESTKFSNETKVELPNDLSGKKLDNREPILKILESK